MDIPSRHLALLLLLCGGSDGTASGGTDDTVHLTGAVLAPGNAVNGPSAGSLPLLSSWTITDTFRRLPLGPGAASAQSSAAQL